MSLTDFLDILSGDEFDERPVTVREFVTNDKYLGLPPLSDNQYKIIEASSQIYKYDTLINLYGPVEGEKRWKQTYTEIIMQLGKGSGKDYTSTIACAYIVYLLLCLKDPARYYGKPPGDSIDILNIAINSQQARNVFFKGFKNRIEKSAWFAGKFTQKADAVSFIKNVTVHSGHSERESWEGYNVILVILDEISGFAIENLSGNENAKTADAIYKMYRGSVDSRFPQFGKVLLLSFPRYKEDFIQQRYNEVIADKETVMQTHTFQIDDELPGGLPDNEFTIEWEEDRIVSYKYPKVFAMKRPTWEVNPLINLEDLKNAFLTDPVDALSRFACMPPEAVDAFFKSRDKVERAFREMNIAITESGSFADWFKPEPDRAYYIHVDLAQKHDRCAVAMAHVDHWKSQRIMGQTNIIAPYIIVDAVRYWTPSSDKSVDFTEVKDYILNLKRLGFDIRMVTFDRWNSHDMMQQLREYGLKSETLSVAKKHYEDMALAVYEDRVKGPHLPILIRELLKLRINKDKVDHPRQGSKDLADATCGAIFNAISLTPKNLNPIIEVYQPKDLTVIDNTDEKVYDEGVIQAPKRDVPPEIEDYLSRMRLI